MDRDVAFAIFAMLWVGLAVAAVAFHKRARLETKTRWHPWIEYGLSILFAAFLTYWVKGAGPGVIAMIWIACFVIATLNWRFVKFCRSCGATVRPNGLTSAMECPKCKAVL
jgi:hypothetical protein